ncbi:MAG: hemolysin family protein [Verrucomicrobiota bacterium]
MTLLIAAMGGGATAAPSGPPTQADVFALTAYILLALFFSFLCSIAEAVLLSITPSYIENEAEKRPKRAKRLRSIKIENIDRSLAAILTLNTIAHTVGAIGSGAKATVVFGSAWFGVFSAVMTLMILFFSEIIPKTIGAVYWTRLVGPTSWFVYGLIFSLYPVVWVSERITRVIAKDNKSPYFSRDEFISMAQLGEKSGQLKDGELRVIRNLFQFGSLTVRDIMTPRTVIAAIPADTSLKEALIFTKVNEFSRIPIYTNSLDEVVGFVLRYEILLENFSQKEDVTVESLKRPIPKVVGSLKLDALLELLLEERKHIVIVIDEFGGTQGLVTLEDLVETLMGLEIVDETDSVEDMRVYARKRWSNRVRQLGIEDPAEKA